MGLSMGLLHGGFIWWLIVITYLGVQSAFEVVFCGFLVLVLIRSS